jgi:hypothetical protein
MQLLSKRCLSTLAIFLSAGDAWAVGPGCSPGNLSLQVKIFGDSHVKLRKPVELHVVVENTGQRQLKLPTPMAPYWHWLRLEARNEQGKILDWHGPELKLLYSYDKRVAIDSGYSYGRSFNNLEEDLDFSKPGTYSIRAIWGIGPDGKCTWGKYTSREFILHVSP